MKYTTVEAFAKVNFILKMLGTLPNGYHALESYMQAVSLKDIAVVGWEEAPKGTGLSISLDPGREDLPRDEGNLAYRAALLMHETFHKELDEHITIKIEKHIPVAAGLAGGSADGAAVITGLARLWGLLSEAAPTDSQLQALVPAAARLGADLPFCLWAQNKKTAAKAYGTGTELKEAVPVRARLVMLTPPISVPTKAVYGELSEADYEKDLAPEIGSLDAFEAAATLPEKTAHMLNHLQYPSLRLFPAIQDSLNALQKISLGGKTPIAVQLSGSGPTCFAIFDAEAQPDEKEAQILKNHHMLIADCL